jgi:hypothetical protein
MNAGVYVARYEIARADTGNHIGENERACNVLIRITIFSAAGGHERATAVVGIGVPSGLLGEFTIIRGIPVLNL